MKKLVIILSFTLLIIGLSACTEEPDYSIFVNLEDGHTIEQYVGEESIQLEDITVTDADDNVLEATLSWEGTYDLQVVGSYALTLSIVVDENRQTSRQMTLNVIPETCEMNPNQEQCVIPVAGVSYRASTLSMSSIYIGDFVLLQWDVTPLNADNTDVTFSSSNPLVAEVNDFGYVFAKLEGTVDITITTVDGSYTATHTFSIIEKSCEVDPLQDKCVNIFLDDDSRIVDLSDGYVSQTNYDAIYPNNKIYYEIFVRRFADTDGDYTGDLNGIIENIPYLEMLGVGGLWLMPIMETTSDHGYDISDYYSINPEYGTMSDFDDLITATSAANIDVIIDLVVNHMGAHNNIFQDVLKYGTSSDYYDWFTWASLGDGVINQTGSWGQPIWYNPNDSTWWLKASSFNIHESLDDKYYFGYFSDWMPDLNLENPDVVDYIYDVAEFWLNKGVTGFRMDATSHLYALHEHPDIIDRDQANIDFLTGFNQHVTSINNDAFVVIEAWESYSVLDYYQSGNSVFNFPFNYGIKDIVRGYNTESLLDSMNSTYDVIYGYNSDAVDSTFISNHDMDRAATQLSDEQIRQASELLLTIPSNPFIYYGDEIGMLGTRTNMVWGSYFSGLATNSADYSVDSVAVQLNDDESLLNTYIQIGELRNNSLALQYGDFTPYHNQQLHGYFRYFENGEDAQLVLVLFNFSSSSSYPIPSEFTSYEILYSSTPSNLGGLSPESTMILQLPLDLLDDVLQ
ncbi:alpha-amylase family glycosyl hydrolase [Candidatus Xianfuyuplasma coldseepsis]|uniref:Glycosyl hydrolase family 13 catalytic domain-containing protein n=1 Tax=Candidatus Xianfuyuplasma coldseepsis TaxID=2782163 RepID=A0A7L7KQY4_9MOLU|nr:alpha-amylase family glycosyl hydrolase [Xianfuyuplasma coldseepsis]QMS84218.1 hypothetical protein G4Z02_00160 [Xianfuyuplasma coldseepsis]